MLDLKIVEEDQYDLVPVPLPGRLMVFAGASGLMCRRNDGTIANYPEAGAGGGGGIIEPLQSLRFVELGAYENMPQHGINGEVVFGYVFGELVKQMPSGAVMGLDNTMRWTPPEGGGGAPEE